MSPAAAPVPESVRRKADRGAALASAGAAAAAAASKFVAAASLAASQQGGDSSSPSIPNVSLMPIAAPSRVPPVRLSMPSLNGAQAVDSFTPPRPSPGPSSQGRGPNAGAQDEDALPGPPRPKKPQREIPSPSGALAADILRPSASNNSLPSRRLAVSPARLNVDSGPTSARASEGPEASPPRTVPRARCAASPSPGAKSPPAGPPTQGPADGVWLKLTGNDRHEEQLVIGSGQLWWPHGATSHVQVLAHDTIRVIMDNGMSFEGRLTDGARMLLWDNGSCWTRMLPMRSPQGALGPGHRQLHSPLGRSPRLDGSESPSRAAPLPCGSPSRSPCGSPPCGIPRPALGSPCPRPRGGPLGAPSPRRSLHSARAPPRSVLLNCLSAQSERLPESSFITADGGQYVWPQGVFRAEHPSCGSPQSAPAAPPSSSVTIPASPSVSSVSLASPPAQPMRTLTDSYGGSS